MDSKKGDLSSKTLVDLKEMMERQRNIVKNKRFTDSLPDKGKKILDFADKISQEIRRKESLEETSTLLSQLSLGAKIVPNHPTLVPTLEESLNGDNADTLMGPEDDDFFTTAIVDAFEGKPCEETFRLNRGKDSETPGGSLLKKGYYEDTALKVFESKRLTQSLSLKESLDLSKKIKEKEKALNEARLLHSLGISSLVDVELSDVEEEVEAAVDAGAVVAKAAATAGDPGDGDEDMEAVD